MEGEVDSAGIKRLSDISRERKAQLKQQRLDVSV